MLHLTSLLLFLTPLTYTFASAIPRRSADDNKHWGGYDPSCCLSDSTASYLVAGYSSLLTSFTPALAQQYLSPTFTDTSDSINFLAGIPLGSVTFPSLDAFIAGQGAQPAIGFTVLSIDAVTCDTIVFRWSAEVGGPDPVKGINVMKAANPSGSQDESGWLIEENWSEFNSAAWVVDIGGTCSGPQ